MQRVPQGIRWAAPGRHPGKRPRSQADRGRRHPENAGRRVHPTERGTQKDLYFGAGYGQNALLKILEEPPEYGAFLILAANAEKLLATIRSRCAELSLSPLTAEEALPALQKRFPDKPRSELCAALLHAGGFLGQAQARLENGQPEHTEAFAAAFSGRDTLALLSVLVPMEKLKRDQLIPILEQWRMLLADALAAKSGFPAESALAASVCRSRTGAELLGAVRSLQSAIDDLNANVGAGPVIGWLTTVLR